MEHPSNLGFKRALPMLGGLLLFGCTHLYAQGVEDTVTKSFPATKGGTLQLDAEYGAVEVKSAEVNEVQVQVLRRVDASAERAREIFNDFDLSGAQSGNVLTVSGKFKTGWQPKDMVDGSWHMCTNRESLQRSWAEKMGNGNARPAEKPTTGLKERKSRNSEDSVCLSYAKQLKKHRYIVTIPKDMNVSVYTRAGHVETGDLAGTLTVRTAGGHVQAGAIGGKVDIRTAGGHISVKKAGGAADLKTAGGHIEVGDVNGDLWAKTAGGHIESGRVNGKVEAKTAGGHIDIGEAKGSIQASTSGGSVTAFMAGQPTEDSRLVSHAGSVKLRIGSAVKADIDAQSTGGSVRSDLELTTAEGSGRRGQKLTGKANGGGPRVELRTSWGTVEVVRAAASY